MNQVERIPSMTDNFKDSDGSKDAQGHHNDYDLHDEDVSQPHSKHEQDSHANDYFDPHDDHNASDDFEHIMRDHANEDHLPEPETSLKRGKRKRKAHEEHEHGVFAYLQSLDGRVLRVEDTLRKMKLDLQTITSLLCSLCKRKNIHNDEDGACASDSSHPEPTFPTPPPPQTETTRLDDSRAIGTAVIFSRLGAA